MRDYLAYGFVPAPRTLFVGIECLRPGSVLIYDRQSRRCRRHELRPPTAAAADATSEGFWRLLRSRVGEADAGGLLLSGGLDSAAVAVAARELGQRPHAYHVRFPAIRRSQDEETAAARRIATELDLPYDELSVTAWTALRSFDRVVDALDQPFGDPVVLPFHALLGRCNDSGGQLLTGEGGDQIFGSWATKPMLLHEAYTAGDGDRLGAYLGSFHKFARQASDIMASRHSAALTAAGEDGLAAVAEAWRSSPSRDLRERLRWIDVRLKGMQHILPRIEAMARAQRRRLLHPFFDPQLIALSFLLPTRERIDGAREKPLLKEALARHLPRDIVERRKAGMGVPTSAWFSLLLRPLAWRWLHPRRLARSGLLRAERVADVLSGELRSADGRRRRWGDHLWQLCVIEAWYASVHRQQQG